MGRKRLKIHVVVGIGPGGQHLKLCQLRVTASKLGEFLRKMRSTQNTIFIVLDPKKCFAADVTRKRSMRYAITYFKQARVSAK